MTAFLGLFRRDLRLALRQGGDTGLVLAFFVLAVVLFPFGVGPEPEVLARVAAGIIWVAALLAALLSLDRLFLPDYEDGGLDLIALSPLPLELAVLAKCAAHWVATGLPLALISPALALVVDLDPRAIGLVREPVDRHAGAEPDRRGRRGVDPGRAPAGRAVVAAGPAALHAAADFRRRRGRGGSDRNRIARRSVAARRAELGRAAAVPMGARGRVAPGARMSRARPRPRCDRVHGGWRHGVDFTL